MEVIIGSKHLTVDYNSAIDVTGREHLVVVAKATWQIPAAGQRPRPLSPQAIQEIDVFEGEPGASAMLYGSDLVRFKPLCDILFNACAHAPEGNPVRVLDVAWQVGQLRKGLKVHGPRIWRKRLGIFSLSTPEPFLSMPLHFGKAFGGTRLYKKGWGNNSRLLTDANHANPDGIGWYGSRTADEVDGELGPNIEALDDPVKKPYGKNKPIAFSAIAPYCLPRPKYAGTYDDAWRANTFPFLPEDFDEQFNQCAPEDQQMRYPEGGEQVILRNMMAGRPDVRFKLPVLNNLTVRLARTDYSSEEIVAVPDTVYFEPDSERFSVVWRASTPVKRRLQEFSKIAIGPVPAHLWQEKLDAMASCMGCERPATNRRPS